MLGIVKTIEKKTVAKAGKYFGKTYYQMGVLIGRIPNLQSRTLSVFPDFISTNPVIQKYVTDDMEKRLAEFEAAKASGKDYTGESYQFKSVIVGDKSINPNDEPLPLHCRVNEDGTRGPVTSVMRVVIMLDDDGQFTVSPRAQALRIIETSDNIELVKVGGMTTDDDENPPV